jgi:hypothetical protein
MAGAEEIWVCANCRSVNKLRARQCYNCRTPKDRAAVDPSSEHVGSRQIALPDFHASRPFAVVASVLILVIGAFQAINTLVSAGLLLRLADGDTITDDEFVGSVVVGLTTIGIGLIALTAWAFWLSKVVRVMPALGLGYPAANGLMAFIENFIPFFNLWRVPAIVRDVVVRLEPKESKGGALIFAAWIGLIAGYLIPRVGGVVGGVVLGIGGASDEEAYRYGAVMNTVAAGLVLVGSLFLVVLIWWIEGRISRHRAAGTEAGAATTTEPAAAEPVEWATATATPASEPAATRTVPGPLGSMVVAAGPDPIANRPIMAATGAAAPLAAPLPEAAPGPAAAATAGPRLHLTIGPDGSMTATLDDVTEPISPKELRDAATALVRVDGSAIVTVADGTPDAIAAAGKALQVLTDAGVPTTTGS